MNKKGFTLIEIMVVIVIMGILAAVAIPKLFGSVAKAKATELSPAASAYIKLQDLYMGEKGCVGNWKSIGYIAPGSGKTNNFEYGEGELIENCTETEEMTGGKVGWQATNTASLNECTSGHWWTVTVVPANGNSASYTNEVNSSDCISLASSFTAGGKEGVSSNENAPKPVGTQLMSAENTSVQTASWKGNAGGSTNSSRDKVAGDRMGTYNTEEGSNGLYELEPNSVYTYTISAEGYDIGENNMRAGILLFEDPTATDAAVLDPGWWGSAGDNQTEKTQNKESNGYKASSVYNKETNTFTISITTGDNVSYFASNISNNQKTVTQTTNSETGEVKTSTTTGITISTQEREAYAAAIKGAKLEKTGVVEKTTASSASTKK